MKHLKSSLVTITPRMAEQFLNANTLNRNLRAGVVEKYAQDMKDGDWTECTVPITFYEDGQIADGQHRLWAIVESKTTQEFFVLRGLSKAAGLNIDTGLNRKLTDNARISGIDKGLTNQIVATARAIEIGTTSKYGSLSFSVLSELVAKHRDAAEFACNCGLKGRFIRNAIVLGAIGRAYYHEADKDKLIRFAEVITKGFSSGEQESAAIALRNYLQSQQSAVSSSALWHDTFKRVQNALWHFVKGKRLMVIKAISEEKYPPKKQK